LVIITVQAYLAKKADTMRLMRLMEEIPTVVGWDEGDEEE
jgi:hypothetical protein